jgi:hypothetical protein
MKYLVMAYESSDAFEARNGGDESPYWGAWSAYAEALRSAGVMEAGYRLQPPATSTTVRLREGKRNVHDGPYAETKEQLGGYCILEAPDLDAALEWAVRCPAASYGAVEVRPLAPSCGEE